MMVDLDIDDGRPRLKSWAGWELVNFELACDWSEHVLIEGEDSEVAWVKDDTSLEMPMPPYDSPGLPREQARALIYKFVNDDHSRARVSVAVPKPAAVKRDSSDRSRTVELHLEEAVELPMSNVGMRVTATRDEVSLEHAKKRGNHRLMFRTLMQEPSNSLLIPNSSFAENEANEDDAALVDRDMAINIIKTFGDPQLVHFGPDVVMITFYDRRETESMMSKLFAGDDTNVEKAIFCVPGILWKGPDGVFYRQDSLLIRSDDGTDTSLDQANVLSILRVRLEAVASFNKVKDGEVLVEFYKVGDCRGALDHAVGSASTRHQFGISLVPAPEALKRKHASLYNFIACDYSVGLKQINYLGVAPGSDDARSSRSRSPAPQTMHYASAVTGSSRAGRLPRSSSAGSSVGSLENSSVTDANSIGSGHTKTRNSSQQKLARSVRASVPEPPRSVDSSDANSRRMRNVPPIHRVPASRGRDNVDYHINVPLVLSGGDPRTSVMIKNIPNKYTQKMVLDELDESGCQGTYDFFYLPIDFQAGCNLGYAFIDFHDPHTIAQFFNTFDQRKWNKFNSDKICEVKYARIQGCESLLRRFENSCVMEQDKEYQPVMFNRDGTMIEDLTTTAAYSKSRSRPQKGRRQRGTGAGVNGTSTRSTGGQRANSPSGPPSSASSPTSSQFPTTHMMPSTSQQDLSQSTVSPNVELSSDVQQQHQQAFYANGSYDFSQQQQSSSQQTNFWSASGNQ
mmetsp:Transcript_842/g.1923  ORF Transcript_842/g.1923 Transcript_842/m.1923 type:complete len:738 (+) Transcript_842:644-2857(+)